MVNYFWKLEQKNIYSTFYLVIKCVGTGCVCVLDGLSLSALNVL